MNGQLPNKIRVVIADDHDLIRQSLKNVLARENDFEVVGEAANGEEVLDLVKKIKVDVIIMDINMPKINGMEATRKVKEDFPDINVLVLTIYDDSEHILSILEAGASGYLTKSIIGEKIPDTVRALCNGESVLSEDVMKKLLEYALRYSSKSTHTCENEKLSAREMEILRLVVKGLNNQAIADELSLSLNTVKRYLTNIFDKLQVKSRTEAVINAQRSGMISIDDID